MSDKNEDTKPDEGAGGGEEAQTGRQQEIDDVIEALCRVVNGQATAEQNARLRRFVHRRS